jgi:hypothetical protein
LEVTGRTRLVHDGAVVGDVPVAGSGSFAVPAGPGSYRLELEAQAGTAYALSTNTTAVWTFPSSHTDSATRMNLPAIRFGPHVDLTNTAPAGRKVEVPVTVDAGRLDSVEVSFDDGKTWCAVPVRRTHHGGTALVTPPRGAGYVSLRAGATGSAGTTGKVAVIRAYRFG